MRISEDFEINTYEDFRKHGREAFDIIAETMDLIYKDLYARNPDIYMNLIIPGFDKFAKIGDVNELHNLSSSFGSFDMRHID